MVFLCLHLLSGPCRCLGYCVGRWTDFWVFFGKARADAVNCLDHLLTRLFFFSYFERVWQWGVLLVMPEDAFLQVPFMLLLFHSLLRELLRSGFFVVKFHTSTTTSLF